MVPWLPVPDDPVASGLDGLVWKGGVAGLGFLKARDIRPRLFEPLEEPRHAAFNPVHVECRDAHAGLVVSG